MPVILLPLFATGVNDTGGKFAGGIVDTRGKIAAGVNNASKNGGKICHACRWYRWQFATGVVDTGGKFAAGIETVLIEYSEALGKVIHEKNQ